MIRLNSDKGVATSLGAIYKSISADLILVEEELKNMVRGFDFESSKEIVEYFFKIPGKRLRPALLLLSARAVNCNTSELQNLNIIRLAAAMELIHAASLVHDDVIDKDFLRRGQKTLNNVFGNKIAVLAGDALYTKAFLTISSLFPKEFMQLVTNMTGSMCMAEIEQARGAEFLCSKERYYRLIKNKTAIFMAYCCKLGASLVTADEDIINAFEDYGMGIGMAYQIVDDYLDNDPIASKYVGLDDAEKFAVQAESSLQEVGDSTHKDSLLRLISYIMDMAHQQA